jgi:hypothetical protein
VPPAANAPNLQRSIDVKIADAGGCANSKQTVTLIALGPPAELESVTFYPDDSRVELKGQKLKGAGIAWSVPGDDKNPGKTGADACLDAAPAKVQVCAIPVPHGLPADAPLYAVAPFGRFGDDVVTYDKLGNRVERDAQRIRPARTVLSKPLVQTGGVDVTNGPGRVVLAHPEAVAAVDCGTASCELVDGGVLVRSVADPSAPVTLRVRLAARVYSARGDALDSVVSTSLPLLSCPMSIVPGTVVRDVDDAQIVVKLDPACSRDPNNLRWSAAGDQAEIRKVVKGPDGTYVLLHINRVTTERITVAAARPDMSNTIVASAIAKTEPLPSPRVSLELKGYGKIDFVPSNRPAAIVVSSAGKLGAFTPLPIDGAYAVVDDNGTTSVRASDSAEGFVSVRLAYRVASLPGELATADLAIIAERTQRAMHEAAVPAPIGSSAYAGVEPLVELVCSDADGKPKSVKPGTVYRIPFAYQDSCRMVLHRERLKPADGAQELTVEIEVTKPDGTPRPERKVSEHMILRPGTAARVMPIKGGFNEFDRIEVRVSHVVDESRYVVSMAAPKPGVLSAQYAAIVDGGRLRLYGTAAIPAGLYRVNHPSGQLTLNFGVLSRLVLLDRQGKESLFGLELGVMGLSLAPQASNVEFPVTLGIVGGIGIRIPLGQGAAIGIQGWVAYELRDGPIQTKDAMGNEMPLSGVGNWSFIFGPSISFGNVGLNL